LGIVSFASLLSKVKNGIKWKFKRNILLQVQ
jgi:hypothetical protein